MCNECGATAPESLEEVRARTHWVRDHPTLVTIGILWFIAIVIPKVVGFSPSGSGFVIMLFSAGVHPLVCTVRGFASLFGRKFFKLSFPEKIRTLGLAIVLFLPSIGLIAFVLAFISDLLSQLKCSGGGCAQGGMGVMMYLPVAWFSSFMITIVSAFFKRKGWWPNKIDPQFISLE